MRLIELRLTDFKGIDVVLAWSQINVLFGPNDAGKTNILEAVSLALGESGNVRGAVGLRPPKFRAMLKFEADDDDVLAALLWLDHVPPIFPSVALADDGFPGAAPTTVAPARLRWLGAGGRSFTLRSARRSPSDGAEIDVSRSWLLSLDAALAALQSQALNAMKRQMRDRPEVWADVEIVLGAALASRRASFENGVLTLLGPTAADVGEEVVAAADRLADAGWSEDAVLGTVVSGLASRTDEPVGFVRFADRRAFRPFEIVWSRQVGDDRDLDAQLRREFDLWYETQSGILSATRDALRNRDLLPAEISEAYDVLRGHLQTQLRNTSPRDRWMRHYPMSSAASAHWVDWLARRVATQANELAAPLVRAAGELFLSVLDMPHWVGEDRRLEPLVQQTHREKSTPLREVGLGLRAWAAVAILEAAAEARVAASVMLQTLGGILELNRELLSGGSPWPWHRVEFGSRRRLLIVDEPERHLHPRAQQELAAWLSTGADARDTLLATHAIPFLNLPEARVTSSLVTRLANGLTHATDISGDMFSTLERMASEAGLSSPAEALQVARLILLVEGTHDERVIHHFYGQVLGQHRVLVVPVRGARNLNAIFDAPWLSRVGLPLVVLFDDVSAEAARARKRPSGRDIAARAVWEMLDNWDRPEPPPRVATFNLPDILRALPEKCVGAAVGAIGGTFPGWETVDDRFGASPGKGFKPVLLEASRLPNDTDPSELLEKALAVCRQKPHPALADAVADVIDAAQMAATSVSVPSRVSDGEIPF